FSCALTSPFGEVFFIHIFSCIVMSFSGIITAYMKRTIASLLLTVLSVIGYGFFIVNAAPPSGGYNPADTLNPDCNPGDPDCFVKLIAHTSGGVIGTGTPT